MAVKRKRRSGGLGMVKTAAKGGKGKPEWLKLEDGDIAYIRVLDTGDNWKDAWTHRTPVERDDGDEMHIDVPCLDQEEEGVPCPGCKNNYRRQYKFWTNAIVRGDEDAEDEDKQKDRLVIWSGGITIAKQLDKLQARHDLRDRDVDVEREGKGKNDTKYTVQWADEEDEPLTDADKKLAEKSHDLNRYTEIPEYDDFHKMPGRRDDDDDDTGKSAVKRGSGFKRRRAAAEDEEDEKPVRRRSGRSGTTSRSKKSESGSKMNSFGPKKDKDKANTTTVRRRPRR